jgi:hypothetical protein
MATFSCKAPIDIRQVLGSEARAVSELKDIKGKKWAFFDDIISGSIKIWENAGPVADIIPHFKVIHGVVLFFFEPGTCLFLGW